MEQLHTNLGNVLECDFKDWQKTWTSVTDIVLARRECGTFLTQVKGVTTEPVHFTNTYAQLYGYLVTFIRTFNETSRPNVTSPDTVKWSSSMRSGIVANRDRNSFTCGITNAWIYIQYWCIYYVISWGYDNMHSGYQVSSPVNTGFKLNSVPATAKMWCWKGNMLKVKFPADSEHNTLLLWNKHCILWMCPNTVTKMC